MRLFSPYSSVGHWLTHWHTDILKSGHKELLLTKRQRRTRGFNSVMSGQFHIIEIFHWVFFENFILCFNSHIHSFSTADQKFDNHIILWPRGESYRWLYLNRISDSIICEMPILGNIESFIKFCCRVDFFSWRIGNDIWIVWFLLQPPKCWVYVTM